MQQGLFRVLFLTLMFAAVLLSPCGAEVNFDFGLPLFGYEEISFDKTKPVDFNLQLLKKFLNEHQGEMLPQLHGISRWFSLIKLSDGPRRKQLIKDSMALFALNKKEKPSSEELMRAIFFNAMFLNQDKNPDQKNEKDQALEEILLDAEEALANNVDYSLIKGLSFHILRNRPNGFFSPMKPEEDLKRALAVMPRKAQYYFVMGQAFRMLGSLDSSLFLAIASFEKASSLDPRNAKLQNSLLGIYMGLHEDYQARGKAEPFWLEEAVYKRILAVSPQNPHVMNNLGYLYAEYGINTQLAQDLCQKAVDMSPENPGFHDSLGWAAFKNRDYVKAEEELLKSLAIKKNVYEPHYHLATVYYATGNLSGAADHYEQAIALRPDSAEALNNLAYLFTEQNRNTDKAVIMAEAAIKLEPTNASYLDTLGWAYYRKGNLDKALVMLKKSAHLAPGQSEILLHIGRVYLDKQDFDLSISYLKEAYKADQKLIDPDNSLYLAIRLKAYHSALADYHTILGAKAEKEKIINILMAISRLYQEEKMFDKAIDLTRLCSDIKNDERDLGKPILGNYTLPEDSKKIALQPQPGADGADAADSEENLDLESTLEKQDIELDLDEETNSAITEPQNISDIKNASTTTASSGETLFVGLPPATNHPLIVSFGPGFFQFIKDFIPGCEVMSDKSITIFVTRLGRMARNATIRIESESVTGTSLLQLLSNYLLQLNIKQLPIDDPDYRQFSAGKYQLYLLAHGNSVYFSRQPLTTAAITPLDALCPYSTETFAELLYSWEPLQKQLHSWLKLVLGNPFKPFSRILTRYTYKNGNLNEFSIATTGKKEEDVFIQKLARDLFRFKLYSQQLGINATIKMRNDDDIIYVSTDFDDLPEFINLRLKKYGFIGPLIIAQLKEKLAPARCFINRTLFVAEQSKACPSGGSITNDPISGLVTCSKHRSTPAIPLFFHDSASCAFGRARLQAIILGQKLNTPVNIKDPKFLVKLAEKYEIPLCPSAGTWTIDASGKIICTDHEN